MATKVIMPQLGESVVEGTVMKWLVQEGEKIAEFDSLLEVESAKVNTEIPSPADGVVLKILIPEGTTVKAGTIIGWIGEPGESIPESDDTGITEVLSESDPTVEEITEPVKSVHKVGRDRELGFISPVVARLAHEHDLDLTLIPGTGQGGRITKKDVLNFVESKNKTEEEPELAAWETPGEGDLFRPTELQFPDRVKPVRTATPEKKGAVPVPTQVSAARAETHSAGEEQFIPHNSMRRSIAEHMVHSKTVAPHVTTVMEVDLHKVVKHRDAHKGKFAEDGVHLTYTAYFMLAVAAALRAFPVVNSSWREDGLLIHKDVNVGMAASLGNEGLIVPVIKHADDFSLIGMARKVNDFAKRAKARGLKPDEVMGGTFTITNHGTSGSLFATPIINQPQCGILGVGAIKKRAVVIDDAIAIRPMVYLSFTFDHRILDGNTADGFLSTIVQSLENWQ